MASSLVTGKRAGGRIAPWVSVPIFSLCFYTVFYAVFYTVFCTVCSLFISLNYPIRKSDGM